MTAMWRNLWVGSMSLLVAAPCFPADGNCASLKLKLASVYNVRRSQVKDEVMRQKLAEADEIWEMVGKDPGLRPCMVEAIEAPEATPFLQLDGAFMLLEGEHSAAYKELFVRVASRTPMSEVWNDDMWMYYLSALGAEGYDISRPAMEWLNNPGRKFIQHIHAYEVGYEAGAVFLLGAMDEDQALPPLVKILNDPAHPGRKVALHLLAGLGTPGSWKALRQVPDKGLDPKSRDFLKGMLSKDPGLLKPKAGKLTREELLGQLDAWDKKDYFPTRNGMLEHDADYTAHWAAVLRAEDLPRLRKMRRMQLSTFREDALGYYLDFSSIILALTWKPEDAPAPLPAPR